MPKGPVLGWIRGVLVLAVCASMIGLALGAASYVIGRGRGQAALDGLTLGAIPLVIALQVVPHVYESVGRLAFVSLAIGFAVLTVADRVGHSVGESAGRAVLFPTMLVHGLADGAALALATSAGGRSGTNFALILAVLVHRVPEGLLLTGAFYRALGARKTAVRLGMLALATVVGAGLGGALLRVVSDAWLDAVVAFGVGAMLRFALHSHDAPPVTQRAKSAAGFAFLLGILFILLIPNPESVLRRAQPMELSVARSFLPLFVETAPALALACVFSSLLHWLGRRDGRAEMRPWRAFAQRVFSPEVLALSVGWFGVNFTVVHLLGSGALSLFVLATLGPAKTAPVGRVKSEPPRESSTLWSDILQTNAVVLGWAFAGLVIASVIEASIAPGLLHSLHGVGALLAALVVGLLLPATWSLLLPIAAVLHHKGMDPTLILALIWSRALALQIQTQMALRLSPDAMRAVGTALAGVGLVFVGLTTFGSSVNVSALSLHSMVFHDHQWFEWLATAVVAVAMLAMVLVLGPRQLWLCMGKTSTNLARPGTTPSDPSAD